MNLIGWVPTYTNERINVYEDEGEVVLHIVGERGGVRASVRLSDYGVDQLDKLTARALKIPA